MFRGAIGGLTRGEVGFLVRSICHRLSWRAVGTRELYDSLVPARRLVTLWCLMKLSEATRCEYLVRSFLLLVVMLFSMPNFIRGAEGQLLERISLYALRKADTDQPQDRVHLRILEGKVYGIWNQYRPGTPTVPVVAENRRLIDAPYWVTNQLVFHQYPGGPVRYLVADTSISPPLLTFSHKQVDGVQWKAEILQQEKGTRGELKHEGVLMYVGITDPQGKEYWLGFNDEPTVKDASQFGWILELRELNLTPHKRFRFQYSYERDRDDGGK